MAPTIRRIVAAGIPVMGHVGLTPQSVHAMGGFKVQGKREEDAQRVLADAKAVAEAGAYAIVLEGIPSELAERITAELPIPTIGIGAGPHCDGQVLVCYDLLGLTPERVPRFVKKYESFYDKGVAAIARYRQEVQDSFSRRRAQLRRGGTDRSRARGGRRARPRRGRSALGSGRLEAAAPRGRNEPVRG